jgi:hypothetical protein
MREIAAMTVYWLRKDDIETAYTTGMTDERIALRADRRSIHTALVAMVPSIHTTGLRISDEDG